ncbi:hypothetical protein WICMUC_003220 [Wickerhamomyces mucosus]|uniref:Large ribosomal subunit protein uL29m n=1 Tax=Wickerhamomyces mucosus TaxID=1378264 RepID=A0A9P8PLV5_9ASCO|nr:hypothetical protein WICMUC_003220 [Wickerhamomyces mucosus]
MTILKRSLHTTSKALARNRQIPLVIKAPIAPTANNIKVSDDHPLWQFFNDKKYLRKYNEIDTVGRPWNIPELRRKSFNDLHSLWYSCLKERNILARETHLLTAEIDQPDRNFLEASDKIRETMWKIRHVLSERYHQQENARLDAEQKERLLEEFEEFYLKGTKEEESELQEALKRLQFAAFGISEIITENTVDKYFIQGLRYIANLKIKRYAPESELSPIQDVGEAFILFHAEANKQDIDQQLLTIKKFREDGISVNRESEIDHIKAYIERLTQN